MHQINSLNKGYFPALTGIRAIAVFMVFIHHYNPFDSSSYVNVIHDFVNEFYVGVTFFFVLSGFLITYRYYGISRENFKEYLINRFARIYPMYFILTSLTFFYLFVHSEGHSDLLKVYLLNISFLKGLFDDLKFSGIAQGWTLTVEEMFYFSAPLSFLLIRKTSKYLVVVIPGCLFLTGVGLVAIFRDVNFLGFFDSLRFMTVYTFFGRASEFFIGVALALLLKKFNTKKTKHVTLIGASVILVCLMALSILKGERDFGVFHPVGLLINNLILPLFGIGVFYWGLLTEKTAISKILSSNLFELLGKSSYTFYLIHIGIISSFVLHFTSNIVYVFIVLNIISILLFKFVEEPLNQYLRRRRVVVNSLQ